MMFKPKLPSFLKLPKYRSFDYQPIYSNTNKPREKKPKSPGDRIKLEFKNKSQKRKNFEVSYGLRMIIIVFLICLLLIYFF